jgi:hypothetical protein
MGKYPKSRTAVGVNIALDKIVLFVHRQKLLNKSSDVTLTSKTAADVFIYTHGKQRLNERLQIASQLWSQNLKVRDMIMIIRNLKKILYFISMTLLFSSSFSHLSGSFVLFQVEYLYDEDSITSVEDAYNFCKEKRILGLIIVKDTSYQTKGEVKLRIVEGKTEEFVRLADIGEYLQQVQCFLFSCFIEDLCCLFHIEHFF